MTKIKKLTMTLVALFAMTAGARADWTGVTYTATANETLGAITVNDDATLTINSDVTVTVTGGITISEGKTLTVVGPGTLVVSGTNGNDGGDYENGGNGSAAVSGTIVVQDGANVTATGGNGGCGGFSEERGGNGGNGGAAFSGAVTIYGGTISASAGYGGGGGDGPSCGDPGNGGIAFAGTLTYYGGSVTATVGNGDVGDSGGGRAFANDVNFVNAPTSLTGGTNTIDQNEVTNYVTVNIEGAGVDVNPTAAPDVEVTWNAATKTGTFDMPASDVVLTPLYAPVAQWATESEVKLLPTAAEGIFAGTTDPIIVEGTVAPGQGTVMYAVTSTNQATAPELSAFSATVPTAENIADEGADLLVWYYIQGAATPDGQEATAENTFNDSEICATPLEVSVLSNQFDITLNAANANTIEGQNGKATVTVKTGDAEAVDKTADIDENHQLKAVKMGSTVTINAKQGYKFRKVEAKKAGPALKTLTVSGMQLKYVEGDTWQQAIERPENEGSGWRVQNNYIYKGGYTLFVNEGTYVYVRPGDTIDATKNYSLEAD